MNQLPLLRLLDDGLERTVREMNPWWRGEPVSKVAPLRRWAFEPVKQSLVKGLAPATVLRGPRQIGKTTLLNQIIDALLREGVAPQRILRLQFDELPALKKTEMPITELAYWFAEHVLGMTLTKAASSKEPAYLFLDEVQNLADWAPQLKNLVDISGVRALVTGSSALRIEAGRDSLAGRIFTFEMGPLLLREVAVFRGLGTIEPYLPHNGLGPLKEKDFWLGLRRFGEEHAELRDAAFRAFSERGAYPVAQANTETPWEQVADFLNESVIRRAIQHDLRMGPRGQKRDEHLLEEVFRLACRYIGQSPAQGLYLDEIRRAMHANVGWQRILAYLKFLDGTLLVRLIEPLELRLKKRRGASKLCLCDHALRSAWLQEVVPLDRDGLAMHPHLADLAGRVAESTAGYFFRSIVGLDVAHFPERATEPEVDFVLTVGEQRIPVEVKYRGRITHDDTIGLRAFIEKAVYRAPFGILVTQQNAPGSDDPRIVSLPLSSLLLMRCTMIRQVIIRRFKRFSDQVFPLEGNVVLAGPNNTGKTTVLQAVAAWNLAFNRWKQLNDFQRHGGGYTKAPIARQAFMAVPLRNFELMWTDRSYTSPAEVEVQTVRGERVTMEFLPDSTEQIYVRPKPSAGPDVLRMLNLRATYIPPMSGPSVEEAVYQRPKIEQLLALQKPGEVLRNLLVEAHHSNAWDDLTASIKRLFGCELLPPDATGADIVAEFRNGPQAPRLDIRSGGSGFQQVLMLLAFLHTRPGSVLLIDEPDAHLHVYLQDSIYSELRRVAARSNSQLVIATHSEVIINSVAPSDLCALYAQPKRLSDAADQRRLADSLGILTLTDVMLAVEAKGILYVEGHTDLDLLREWAAVLQHPIYQWLSTQPFWRATVVQNREEGPGVQATQHHEALTLVRNDIPALELRDADARVIPDTPITGTGFQRIRWKRYEAESYLVHPAALERFIEQKLGGAAAAGPAVQAMKEDLANLLGSRDLAAGLAGNPHEPALIVEQFLRTTKARVDILPRLLTAAGLYGFDYTRYSEIAALMKPEEIHPEVREKLDAIQRALRL